MTRAERRAAVKRAWVEANGKPDRMQLAARFGVNASTITRDIAKIQQQIALEGDLDDARMQSAAFFERMRDWAEALAMNDTKRISDNARVGFARVALDANAKRDLLLGHNAPQKIQGQIEYIVKGYANVSPDEWPEQERALVQ